MREIARSECLRGLRQPVEGACQVACQQHSGDRRRRDREDDREEDRPVHARKEVAFRGAEHHLSEADRRSGQRHAHPRLAAKVPPERLLHGGAGHESRHQDGDARDAEERDKHSGEERAASHLACTL